MIEDSTTFTSLDNAKQLIQQHGVPSELHFKADTKKVDYSIEAHWPDGTTHTFEGFSWGYAGTGPAGLAQFLELAQISSLLVDEIPVDKYNKTNCSWYRDPQAGTLNEVDWRLIHNALVVYQGQFVKFDSKKVNELQVLMDKVRDYKIAPSVEANPLDGESSGFPADSMDY